MTMDDENEKRTRLNTRCPRCGEPARVVIITKALVRCVLERDGDIGRVISASRRDGGVEAFECGARHRWNA